MAYSAQPRSSHIRPDPVQIWAGGAATAIVAALIALVGVLICRWTLGIPILAPSSEGAWGNANTGVFVLVAALVALAATAVLHLLMLGTPEPNAFIGWIMGLITLAAVVYPFSTSAPLNQKIATAIVCLVLGVAIASLLSGIAARAVKVASRRDLDRRAYPDRGPDPRYGDPRYGDPRYGDPRYGDRGPDPRYGDRGPDPRYGDPRGYDERRGYDVHDQRTQQYPQGRDDRW
jgi:hypothetical protein